MHLTHLTVLNINQVFNDFANNNLIWKKLVTVYRNDNICKERAKIVQLSKQWKYPNFLCFVAMYTKKQLQVKEARRFKWKEPHR